MLNPQFFSPVQLVYFSPSEFDLVVSDKLFFRVFFLIVISVQSFLTACLWSCVSVSITVFLLFLSGRKVKPEKTCSQLAISHFFYSEHWDYHPHPHAHPVEFENLQETNFTELQSVQALHPPSLIRQDVIRYDGENLIDPNLGAHSHVLQQPVSPPESPPPPTHTRKLLLFTVFSFCLNLAEAKFKLTGS